jgi:hypothetical protein
MQINILYALKNELLNETYASIGEIYLYRARSNPLSKVKLKSSRAIEILSIVDEIYEQQSL